MKRVDRKFNASDMLTHSPSAEELRKFLPMIGCQSDCILDELGRCSEVLIADDLAGVVVQMDEFALSALSRESASNSSLHVSVFNCCPALDTIIVT